MTDSEESNAVSVTSSVPQGVVLGPVLFLIITDDMPKYVHHSWVQIFVDDAIIIYLSVSSVDDCNRLQEDLQIKYDCESEWLMEFRPSRCHVL